MKSITSIGLVVSVWYIYLFQSTKEIIPKNTECIIVIEGAQNITIRSNYPDRIHNQTEYFSELEKEYKQPTANPKPEISLPKNNSPDQANVKGISKNNETEPNVNTNPKPEIEQIEDKKNEKQGENKDEEPDKQISNAYKQGYDIIQNIIINQNKLNTLLENKDILSNGQPQTKGTVDPEAQLIAKKIKEDINRAVTINRNIRSNIIQLANSMTNPLLTYDNFGAELVESDIDNSIEPMSLEDSSKQEIEVSSIQPEEKVPETQVPEVESSLVPPSKEPKEPEISQEPKETSPNTSKQPDNQESVEEANINTEQIVSHKISEESNSKTETIVSPVQEIPIQETNPLIPLTPLVPSKQDEIVLSKQEETVPSKQEETISPKQEEPIIPPAPPMPPASPDSTKTIESASIELTETEIETERQIKPQPDPTKKPEQQSEPEPTKTTESEPEIKPQPEPTVQINEN
ncbi:hypothetical protein NEOKW01_0305 [Nematocida sp. AWRm80]|nr:hypothetical protein NEOKW01_0305 [Nematocida sp. AWRm80]